LPSRYVEFSAVSLPGMQAAPCAFDPSDLARKPDGGPTAHDVTAGVPEH
jgi:hypothetical protein